MTAPDSGLRLMTGPNCAAMRAREVTLSVEAAVRLSRCFLVSAPAPNTEDLSEGLGALGSLTHWPFLSSNRPERNTCSASAASWTTLPARAILASLPAPMVGSAYHVSAM